MREKLNEEQQKQDQLKSTSDFVSKRSSSFTEPRTQHVRPSFLNNKKTNSQHQSRKPYFPDATGNIENQMSIITCNAGSVKSLVDIYETIQPVFIFSLIYVYFTVS